MTAKYITASLLIVLRRFGPLTPRYIGSKIRACTTTETRTAMSKRAGREFGSRDERIRNNNEMPTKDEIESYLSDYPTSLSVIKT